MTTGTEPSATTTIVSYAQNGEDVVLWRALGHVENGFYVDVGAAWPIHDSVTKTLYEHGWRGIDIEPVEQFAAALRADRTENTVVEAAISDSEGQLTFYQVPDTGLSTADKGDAERARDRGFEVTERSVDVRTLNSVLYEYVDQTTDIHLLKVDVEGLEADVLRGLDLNVWKPWVIVVEATRPLETVSTREQFEHILLDHDYKPVLFDGLNVFYLSAEHPELEADLSYPACALDDFIRASLLESLGEVQQQTTEWQGAWARSEAELVTSVLEATRLRATVETARRQAKAAQRRRRQIERSQWWRLTAPARKATNRLKKSGQRAPSSVETGKVETATPRTARDLVAGQAGYSAVAREVLRVRLRELHAALGLTVPDDTPLETLLQHTVRGLETAKSPKGLLWTLFVTFQSTYPIDADVARLYRTYLLDGAHETVLQLTKPRPYQVPNWTATSPIRFLSEPVVDVTHTSSHDLHTGVQRVVRETVKRWAEHHPLTLAKFDSEVGVYRPLSPAEEGRILRWNSATNDAPSDDPPEVILVPLNGELIVPEICGEPARSEALAAYGSWSDCDLNVIFYDLIPFTLSEACVTAMPQNFSQYMTVIRRSDRVSTISQSVAADLNGFLTAVANQGLEPPSVQAHPLPTQAERVSPATVAACENALTAVPGLPMVLYVSSIEPRKNHIVFLTAAEILWREGLAFQLTLIAGSGWKREMFNEQLAEARERGRPIRILEKADETLLWSAYQLARFSVFISTSEGFGLPAAESLAAGTPVVLSDFGSMREIGSEGGAEMVDPRDVTSVVNAMRTLLTDDAHLEALRQKAKSRPQPTWDDYASATWSWLADRA